MFAWQPAVLATEAGGSLTDLEAVLQRSWDGVFLPEEPETERVHDWLVARGVRCQVGSAWALGDLGDLSESIAAHGVEFSARAGSCRRPGRYRLGEPLELDLLADGPIRIEGSGCWDRPAHVRRLLSCLRHPAHHHRAVHTVGLTGPTSATAIAEAVRSVLRLRARGQDTRVHVDAEPRDPWAEAALPLLEEVLTATHAAAVQACWMGMSAPATRTREQERLLGLLDDVGRLSQLHALVDQPRVQVDGVESSPGWPRAVEALGAPETWERARRHMHMLQRPKMVLIPTWQCELRCVYCTIPKQDGRVMTPAVAERAVELLLSSDADDLLVHFFGGEPLLNVPLIEHTLQYATERADRVGRRVRFQITSNAFSATDDVLDRLAGYPVRFELSLDGDRATQTAVRRTARHGDDSYTRSPAHRARAFLDRGFEVDAIMVVHKTNADRLIDNFWHLAGMGYPRVQINFAYGNLWPDAARRTFARNLFELGDQLRQGWEAGTTQVELVNLGESLRQVRTNSEITVDWDGRLYGSNSFLYAPAMERDQRLGHLDDPGVGIERYLLDNYDADHIMAHSYRDRVSRNNLEVGDVLTTFVRWMHAQGVVGPS